ncbi:MAG: hydroxymethylglutaryl-CoA lyase [Bacteroidia bacterium]
MKIIECPRDAMQGFSRFIPTAEKIAYLTLLLKVGFDTLDFGSFVSPKAIPQLADTQEVLANLDLTNTNTKLLAIVANQRGAETACQFPEIQYLGYPFSISETFQLRNTNRTIADSVVLVEEMQALCVKNNKELVVYISMGFGNPYGDDWSVEIAEKWVQKMAEMGIRIVSLADTVGSAEADSISYLYANLIPRFPAIEFGAHFHATPEARITKLQAAYQQGCRRFDAAIKGFGGCPFAEDDLVGNIATETLLSFLASENIDLQINKEAFRDALLMSASVFA